MQIGVIIVLWGDLSFEQALGKVVDRRLASHMGWAPLEGGGDPSSGHAGNYRSPDAA